VIRFLTEERGIKHTVSVSLQTQCLWRKELLDDMGFERSSSVIETAKEVNGVGFFLVVRPTSLRSVRNRRENVWVREDNHFKYRYTKLTVILDVVIDHYDRSKYLR